MTRPGVPHLPTSENLWSLRRSPYRPRKSKHSWRLARSINSTNPTLQDRLFQKTTA